MMAIQHTDFTIHGAYVAVLRSWASWYECGESIPCTWGKSKSWSKKERAYRKNYGNGIQPFHLNELNQEVKDVDIVINTIPFPLLRQCDCKYACPYTNY